MELMAKINGIGKAILDKLYSNFNLHGWPVTINLNDLEAIGKSLEVDEEEVNKAVIYLCDLGLIEPHSTFDYKADSFAINTYERNFFTPLVYKNNEIRRLLLRLLMDCYHSEANKFFTPDDLSVDSPLMHHHSNEIINNLWILEKRGYIRGNFLSGGYYHFRITASGIDLVDDPKNISKELPISDADRINAQTTL